MNKEIEILNKKIDAQDKIINTQALEIARLKEQLENDIDRYEDTISYQLGFDKGKEYIQQRIDKAIEYIKEELYEVGGCIHGSDLPHSAIEPILEILGDKENE